MAKKSNGNDILIKMRIEYMRARAITELQDFAEWLATATLPGRHSAGVEPGGRLAGELPQPAGPGRWQVRAVLRGVSDIRRRRRAVQHHADDERSRTV